MGELELPSFICVHDDHWFLSSAIRAVIAAGPVTVFVSRVAWDGSQGDWKRAAEEATSSGAEVVLGDWPDESIHRKAALAEMRARNFEFALMPDGDEVIETELLRSLQHVAATGLADVVSARMDTYWKGSDFVIRPREELSPAIMVNVQRAEHLHIREFSGDRRISLSPAHGLIHHLSYAGPDERILRKITTWGHRGEVIDGWFQRVWIGWNSDPLWPDEPAYRYPFAPQQFVDPKGLDPFGDWVRDWNDYLRRLMPPVPPAPTNDYCLPFPRFDPNPWITKWGYGNWCGQSRPGKDTLVKPMDELDSCCMAHDGNLGKNMFQGEGGCSHCMLAKCASKASCAKAPSPFECEIARAGLVAVMKELCGGEKLSNLNCFLL